MILICAAIAWTCALTVAFGQENPDAKHTNVQAVHRSSHASKHSAAHHEAMAAGKASIKSHPSYRKDPYHYHY